MINLCPLGLCVDVEVPLDREEADRLCLRISWSIFANILSKDVFDIDGHAYISLSDVISRTFAQSTEFSFMKAYGVINSNGFNGTDRTKELLKELEKGLNDEERKKPFW